MISVEWHHNDQPSVISSHYSAAKALRHLLKPNLLSHPYSLLDDILLVSSLLTALTTQATQPASNCRLLAWCDVNPHLEGHMSQDMGPR